VLLVLLLLLLVLLCLCAYCLLPAVAVLLSPKCMRVWGVGVRELGEIGPGAVDVDMFLDNLLIGIAVLS
jgi:hypothetical protein